MLAGKVASVEVGGGGGDEGRVGKKGFLGWSLLFGVEVKGYLGWV